MWPFKKKRALPFESSLTKPEEEWLETQRAGLQKFAGMIAIPPGTNSLIVADRVIQWWHSQPRENRVDANLVVSAAGVALGDELAKKLGLEWKIITDSFGTDMGLWWQRGELNLVLSPTHSVAKRFAESGDGLVSELFETLSKHATSLMHGAERG